MAKGEATELFAKERGDGLAAILGNLQQTVFGEPAYPSVEEKRHICCILLSKTTLLPMAINAVGRFCLWIFCTEMDGCLSQEIRQSSTTQD